MRVIKFITNFFLYVLKYPDVFSIILITILHIFCLQYSLFKTELPFLYTCSQLLLQLVARNILVVFVLCIHCG